MQTIVKVTKLKKSYGKQLVLNDISFEINEGEIVGFIGPNGAGKSTLMKCMCNLIKMDSGVVTICGKDLIRERDAALQLQSSLIEAPGLFLNMSGKQNLSLFASLKGVSKQRLKEMIEFTKLDKQINKNVSEYSLGMKQRLALAIALLSEPRFLMLDEPMNGLDPTGVHELREELKYMVKKYNMALLISSHQLNEIEKIADRIIYINKGEIKELEMINETYIYHMKLCCQLDLSKIEWHKFEKMVDTNYKIIINDETELAEMIQLLTKNNIKILDITKVERNLEDEYDEIYEVS